MHVLSKALLSLILLLAGFTVSAAPAAADPTTLCVVRATTTSINQMTCSSIAQSFDVIRIAGRVRSNNPGYCSVESPKIQIRFNGDTGGTTNYNWARAAWSGGTSSTTQANNVAEGILGWLPTDGSCYPSAGFSSFDAVCMYSNDYDTGHKTCQWQNAHFGGVSSFGSNSVYVSVGTVAWHPATSADITGVTLTSSDGSNFEIGSYMVITGE